MPNKKTISMVEKNIPIQNIFFLLNSIFGLTNKDKLIKPRTKKEEKISTALIFSMNIAVSKEPIVLLNTSVI